MGIPRARLRCAVAVLGLLAPLRARVTWTRVSGFLPTGIGDLDRGFHTLDSAQSWCAARVECRGFSVTGRDDQRSPGSVVQAFFKRTTEYFDTSGDDWVSYVKGLTPCTRAFYRTHAATGLTCCDGACPGMPGDLDEAHCEMPAWVEGDTRLPTCSALDLEAGAGRTTTPPLTLAAGTGERAARARRVFNLARLGTADMSSAYLEGPASWQDAATAIDGLDAPDTVVHTLCGEGEWWRVNLSQASDLFEVHVANRAEFQYRLLDVRLQVLGGEAGAEALAERPVTRAANRTIWVFRPPVRGARRIVLRGPPGRAECLHVSEVTALGRAASTPAQHAKVLRHVAPAVSSGPPPAGAAGDGKGKGGKSDGKATGGRAGEWPPVAPWLLALATTAALVALQAQSVRGILLQLVANT